ncbi:short-chain dehydrogenase [Paraphaeosphaeria sporulosa]
MALRTLVRRAAGASSAWRSVSRTQPEHLRRRAFVAPPQYRFASSNSGYSEDRAPYEKGESVGSKPFSQFDVRGKVFVVTDTGGGRGLGLSMAEGLVEAGGRVHCLDRLEQPDPAFKESAERMKREFGSELVYHDVDVTKEEALETVVADVAAERQRLDGLIAAAAIQQVTPALDYSAADIAKMLLVNYTGVFLSARVCARQMHKYKIQGSICLIASMSGTIANKGFIAPVYNSSKAAVVQLAKNLAMEWGRTNPDGSGGIRVNSLSPGHIVTPMAEENFGRGEADRAEWENNNMLGRLSTPEEYKAAGLFLLSRASSYMTGNNMIMDGGATAW